jgi:predicted glycosyltransferase
LRVWIDALTPKQALFFAPLRQSLLTQNHEVLVTTREYREAVQTLQLKKIPHKVVGRHGGGTAYGKLLASGERVARLAKVAEEWKPDVAVSFSSPEAARVAFGLAIPHVTANDSPHSWRVALLTIPLSRFVCYPWVIPRQAWLGLGAKPSSLASYRALDPAAWLKRYRPSPRTLRNLGLDKDRPLVVLRTEEAFAAYLMGRASDRFPVILPIIDRLLRLDLDLQLVVSTRYGQQAPVLRKRFKDKVTIIDRIIDATSLLSYTSVFIGSGGTMTVEAALMGTLALSCFPGQTPIYIEYLEKRRLVDTIKSPKLIASRAQDMIANPEKYQARKDEGKKLLDWMEDPVKKITGKIKQAAR